MGVWLGLMPLMIFPERTITDCLLCSQRQRLERGDGTNVGGL